MRRRPEGYVAQELVALSRHPTLVDGRLEPRHVDLRAFVFLAGERADGAARRAHARRARRGRAGRQLVAERRREGHLGPRADPARGLPSCLLAVRVRRRDPPRTPEHEMKALTWHGKRDVRVDTVPDPTIEQPTDAIVRITSTGICGSDLHLYEVLGPFIERGRHPRPRADGHRRGGRRRGEQHRARRPRRDPVQHLLRPLLHVRARAAVQCETTQVREQGMGAALFGYTKLYGEVPGGQARVPARAAGAVRADQGARGPAGRALRLPLRRAADGVAGGRVRRRCPRRHVLVLGLGPIGEMATRIAQQRGAGRVIGRRPASPSASSAHGARRRDARPRRRTTTVPAAVRELTDGRGPDSVIDAVGMEAHGAPVGKLAHRLAGAAARRRRREADGDAGHRPAQRAALGHRHRPPRRHDLADRRLRRRGRPDAA